MNCSRRMWLRNALAAAIGIAFAGVLSRTARAARPDEAFAAKSPADALRELFGDAPITPTDRIAIKMPALAEDGAVVPVTISTDLPSVQSISIVSQRNPVPLIARFHFGSGAMGSYIATRIKLAETEEVIFVVQSDGKLYSARQPVRVLIGGCS